MYKVIKSFAAAATVTIALGYGAQIVPVADAKPVQVSDLLAASPAGDWRTPDPENTVYLQIPGGRVIIELAARIAPAHVANIKSLARAHYFDDGAIVRAQDNYVVQWSDGGHHHPVPANVHNAVELTAAASAYARFQPLPDHDVYAAQVGFIDGFPAARDPRAHTAWLAHCYGMVGAGRDDSADSDGTELYAVIGQAPRQLDRNVALVGRVLAGMELLSTLPRGNGAMGFYAAPQPMVPILSVHVAADVPSAERTQIQVLRTDSATFHTVLDERRNRRDAWFKYDPARIDLCNVPLPVRVVSHDKVVYQ